MIFPVLLPLKLLAARRPAKAREEKRNTLSVMIVNLSELAAQVVFLAADDRPIDACEQNQARQLPGSNFLRPGQTLRPSTRFRDKEDCACRRKDRSWRVSGSSQDGPRQRRGAPPPPRPRRRRQGGASPWAGKRSGRRRRAEIPAAHASARPRQRRRYPCALASRFSTAATTDSTEMPGRYAGFAPRRVWLIGPRFERAMSSAANGPLRTGSVGP